MISYIGYFNNANDIVVLMGTLVILAGHETCVTQQNESICLEAQYTFRYGGR